MPCATDRKTACRKDRRANSLSVTLLNRLLTSLHETAAAEGFVLAGVAPAVTSTGFHQLTQWIEAGHAASMDYFANRLHAYEHPRYVLEGVRSILVLTYPYDAAKRDAPEIGSGRIARYVGDGSDYHDVIHPKLRRLGKTIVDARPEAAVRGIVDTAPLMEREVAVAAGLGWQGKNTLLLNREHGSYFLLACLLTSVELPLSQPHLTSHCGTCTACLDACPTQAFPSPGVLNASRCISYLTIEHDGPIDETLRSGIGDWLFGCDVCQDVCPWNRKPTRRAESDRTETPATEFGDTAEFRDIQLAELFDSDDASFRAQFRKTPFWRSRRRGLLRNAAIVLGNQRDPEAAKALAKGLNDTEPIVRGASAWALGQIGDNFSRELLVCRLNNEHEPAVRSEIVTALGNF